MVMVSLLLLHPVEWDGGGKPSPTKAVGEDELCARVVRWLSRAQPPNVRQVLGQGGEASAQGFRRLEACVLSWAWGRVGGARG